VTKHSSIYCK